MSKSVLSNPPEQKKTATARISVDKGHPMEKNMDMAGMEMGKKVRVMMEGVMKGMHDDEYDKGFNMELHKVGHGTADGTGSGAPETLAAAMKSLKSSRTVKS